MLYSWAENCQLWIDFILLFVLDTFRERFPSGWFTKCSPLPKKKMQAVLHSAHHCSNIEIRLYAIFHNCCNQRSFFVLSYFFFPVIFIVIQLHVQAIKCISCSENDTDARTNLHEHNSFFSILLASWMWCHSDQINM